MERFIAVPINVMTPQENGRIISEQPVKNSIINLPDSISVSLSTDAILAITLFIWVIWDRFTRPSIVKKLDGVFAPIEEERKLSSLLSQVGIITGASRVVLAAFHNGALDNAGYHLQKLSTVNTYVSPGCSAMTAPIKDLPIGRIMYELESMMRSEGWWCSQYSDDLPDPCKDHLIRNKIYKMCNRLVKVGNLPIGILSLQYESAEKTPSFIVNPEHELVMDELYNHIAAIMRRRIIHPSFLQRAWNKVLALKTDFVKFK